MVEENRKLVKAVVESGAGGNGGGLGGHGRSGSDVIVEQVQTYWIRILCAEGGTVGSLVPDGFPRFPRRPP